MRYVLIILLVTITRVSFAQAQLNNFEQVMTALKAGKQVKVVIYYGKCDLFSDGVKQEKSPDAIGGMKIDTYEYFDSSVFKGKLPSFLTTSQTILISHRKYGYVQNYVKLKVLMDGSVEVTARYLKNRRLSAKYKVVMDETFKSKINDGINNAGVVFFAE